MTFDEIDERLDQFEQKLQEELKQVENGTFCSVAPDYEPIDSDPPPVVF